MSKRRTPKGRQYHARRRKKIKFILNIFKIVILIAAVYGILAFTPIMNLNNIYVEGVSIVSVEEILEKAAIPEDINILRMNMGEIEKRIEQIPYVSDAKIKYKFPNNIRIVITEGSVYHAFKTEEGYVNTDEDLKVLEITDMPKIYPTILDLNIQDYEIGKKLTIDETEKFDIILLYTKILKKKNMIEDVELVYVEDYNFMFRFKSGASVKCGNTSEAERKITALKAAIDTMVAENGTVPTTGSFDISDPQQIVYSIE